MRDGGESMTAKRSVVFLMWFFLAALAPVMGQDRIELGWQTTRRGIVWYQSGKPTHQPAYRLSRDTNAVLWVDTLTALRYDWDYKNDRWRTRGTSKSALPPLPQQASGSALIDNTTAFWIRDTFNLLHKYDSTANAWTPIGDFMFLSNVPTEIAATGSNGAAKYRQSLWQDADTYLVYYWDGAVWQQFGNASGGDNWGTQVAQVTPRLSGDGTAGLPLDIAQQGATSGQALKWNGTTWVPQNDADTDAQNLTIEGSSPTYDIAISGGTDVTIAGAGIVTLSESPANTLVVTATEVDGSVTNEGSLTVGAGGANSSTIVSNTSSSTAVTVAGAGIVTVTESGSTITVTGTEVDGETNNEGILGVGAGGANTATLLSNTIGQSPVTVSGATGIGVSESPSGNGGTITVSPANDIAALEALGSTGIAVRTGSETWAQRTITAGTGISVADGNGVAGNPTITNTGDLSATNEAWTVDADDADTELITTQTVKFQGGGITVTDYIPGTDILTITSTEADGSTTNELQAFGHSGTTSYTNTLSNSGGSFTLQSGGIVSLSHTTGTTTISATEVDGSITNEGSLTVGAGGANSSTIVSNTSGSTAVTVAGAGIVTVTESGSTITVTGTEVDGSTTNELQTLNSTGDATSHTATLSSSGGSLKLKEGANVTLTTDVTGLNGEVTIAATIPAGDDGIYGDGTPGSGSDILPPGGSVVTIPGQWQPLAFAIDNAASQVHTALRVTTDYCADDAWTKYLVGKSPSDSLELFNFNCEAWIKETGGTLNLQTDRELFVFSDSINLATVPARTIGAAMLAQEASGWVRKISGTSSGQILQWNGTNWALASAPVGTLDGAENGLYVASNKARLGGTLIETTQINQSGNEMRFYGYKWSQMRHTFGYTPVQYFGVSGYEGDPTAGATPTADGIAEFVATTTGGSLQSNGLHLGAYANDNAGTWVQSRSNAVPNFSYPLALNPRGGVVSVGRGASIPTARFTVTATAATGSTASGLVALFENLEGSQNTKIGFGTGSDNLGSEINWRSVDDVLRITNRNNAAGTSRISFAIGGETTDKAHLITSSVTPNARFGVGTTTAATHSTITSAGSLATAYTPITSSTTLDERHHTVVYTLNSNITVTLPNATSCTGRQYIIHHFGSGGNVALSANVISSTGTTFGAVGARQWAYIFSDGNNWQGYLLTSQ